MVLLQRIPSGTDGPGQELIHQPARVWCERAIPLQVLQMIDQAPHPPRSASPRGVGRKGPQVGHQVLALDEDSRTSWRRRTGATRARPKLPSTDWIVG